MPPGPFSRRRLQAVQAERQRRRGDKPQPRFDPLPHLFPKAREALTDPARHRAWPAGRGSAKTTTSQYALLEAATSFRGCAVIYLSTTLLRATKTVWTAEDGLPALSALHGLGGEPSEKHMSIRFPNSAVLYVGGVETRKLADRWRGPKRIKLVVIDEAQDWDPDLLEYTIAQVLLPRLNDKLDGQPGDGRLIVQGTGGPRRGFWFRIVTEKALGFSVKSWTANDNPHVAPLAQQVAEACQMRGVKEDDPFIRREYKAEFTDAGVTQVLPFDLSRNGVAAAGLPQGKVFTVLGVDVGSVDQTAVVVWRWVPHRDHLYVAEAEKRTTPASSDQVAMVREYIERYEGTGGLLGTYVDPGGGGKGVIEDLRKIRKLWEVHAADKAGKVSAAINAASDLRTGRILVREDLVQLIEALGVPEWPPGKVHEDLGDQHWPDLADGWLYGYRAAAQMFHFEAATEGPKTPEQAELERVAEQLAREEAHLAELLD
jgi:hypothetical protein